MKKYFRFHSISFPSEWGPSTATFTVAKLIIAGFHSISFPSEWGLAAVNEQVFKKERTETEGFHSISFPSEWGQKWKTT